MVIQLVTGIQICGLNGSGKSTLGIALAEKTGFQFIDNENLYFERSSADEPYSNPKSRKEVEKLLADEIKTHGNFIFSAVRGDYGGEIVSLYKCVILIKVPKEIRMQRVRNRSYQKFGSRVLPGGDLYESEKLFYHMVESRSEDYVESWVKTLGCQVIEIDGTKPVDENIELIMEQIYMHQNWR